MEARDSLFRQRRVALALAAVATLSTTAVADALNLRVGPLVVFYLLAALLASGLSPREFRSLCGLIALAMVIPILVGLRQEPAIALIDAVERLTGLVCLGVLAAVLDQWQQRNDVEMPSTTTSRGWMEKSVPPRLATASASADSIELDSLECIGEIARIVDSSHSSSGALTSSLTEIRYSDDDGIQTRLMESELSFDEASSHGEASLLGKRLTEIGGFSPQQIAIVESELREILTRGSTARIGAPLEPGIRVGRFVVDQPVGRGGEGHVYRGRDSSGETAAIKILHNLRVSDRFRREMHLVRQLAHPHIVTAYEVGDFQGVPFITMEWLCGPDLHVFVRDSGRVSWQQSARYILQAAHALAHAHDRGLIHRDIKPGNLILNGAGLVKLADLGLASMEGNDAGIDSVVQFETKEGHLAGTLPYMAPEQARSLANATVQSDIYGLGATWFYLLTGRERLRGKTFLQQLQNLLLTRKFHRLPAGALPESLREVYVRMVAYDVRDRYADCRKLAAELQFAMAEAGEHAIGIEGIRVLVVEDSRTDMMLTIEMLRRSNSTLMIQQARSLSEALNICRNTTVNLVLLDLSLPDSSGVETVRRFREEVRGTPLVVLTGLNRDDVGAQCLQAGATAFLSKSGLTPHRMERAIFVTLSRCGPKPPNDDRKV